MEEKNNQWGPPTGEFAPTEVPLATAAEPKLQKYVQEYSKADSEGKNLVISEAISLLVEVVMFFPNMFLSKKTTEQKQEKIKLSSYSNAAKIIAVSIVAIFLLGIFWIISLIL